MRDSSKKVIVMQWVVILVLVIGAGVGAYLMINKVNLLNDDNQMLTGDNASLRNQLKQLKQPTPTPTPEVTPAPQTSPTPVASPTVTPKPTATPKSNL